MEIMKERKRFMTWTPWRGTFCLTFLHVARVKKTRACENCTRNTRTCENCTRNSHVRVFSDSCNVQKSVTRIIYLGPLPRALKQISYARPAISYADWKRRCRDEPDAPWWWCCWMTPTRLSFTSPVRSRWASPRSWWAGVFGPEFESVAC